MLNFKRFLIEYLTDEQRARYKDTEMTDEARAATDHFFGKNVDEIHGEIKNDDKSEVHKQLEQHLNRPLTHEEYSAGVIKDKYNRDVKLGRLIKDNSLRNQFDKDPARKLGPTSNKTRTVRGIEVAGQTNPTPNAEHPKGHSWADISCKNIEDGINKHYLDDEIKHGTVVHFVHDHNGQEIYRATLQPHHNNAGHTVYKLDAEYGVKHPKFTEDAHRIANELSTKKKIPGDLMFRKPYEVYNDSGEIRTLHPHATARDITKALDSKDWQVREAAIKHPMATATHLTRALNDDDWDVKDAAIKHPNINEKHLTQALKSSSSDLGVRAVNHPKVTAQHIDLAMKHPEWQVRETAAGHKFATEAHLTKALDDTDSDVRSAAVRNPNATEAHITKALNDKHVDVRRSAMRNPRATPEHITKALEDSSWQVRHTAIKHPNVTSDHLMKAIHDEDGDVLEAAWKHPKIDHTHIDQAINHSDLRSVASAIAHPKATAEHIDKAVASAHDEFRKRHYLTSAIQNPSMGAHHLDTLSKDREWSVRRRVARHPNVTPKILRRLARDEDVDVKNAAKQRLAELK